MMPNQNGGAVQFLAPQTRFQFTESSVDPSLLTAENRDLARSMMEQKRWRSPQKPDAGVLAFTKEEAETHFKRLLGVDSLPVGFEIESY